MTRPAQGAELRGGAPRRPRMRADWRPRNMKIAVLWAECCAVILAVPLAAFGAEGGLAPSPADDAAEIRRLRVEINALNLINGLHLSIAQVQALVDGAREMKALAEKLPPDRGPGKDMAAEEAAAMCAALEKVLACLRKGEDPPPALLAELKEKTGKTGRREATGVEKSEYNRNVVEIEARVGALLSDAQREVIEEFKPCLVPPKTLRDPVRVGQVRTFEAQEAFLERARKIPSERWAKLGKLIVDKAMRKWEEKNGALPAKARADEIEKAMTLIDQARSMPEVEFQISKSSLAEKLIFMDRKDEIHKELESLASRRDAPPGKIARILLDPRIIPALERRLAIMKNGGKDPAVDLEDIEGADTCKGGKCGTPAKKE